jgi:hypothetical protein
LVWFALTLSLGCCPKPEQELWNFRMGEVCSAVDAGVWGNPNVHLSSQRIIAMAGLPDASGTPAARESNLAMSSFRATAILEELSRRSLRGRQQPLAPELAAATRGSRDQGAPPARRIWLYDEGRRFDSPGCCLGFALYAIVLEDDQAVAAVKLLP